MKKRFLRNKSEIIIDYKNDLLKHSLIKPEDELNIIEDLLDKKIHETESYKGVQIATLDAFYHFCNYVVKKDYATDRMIWNSFIKKMFLVVEKHQYNCIEAARGHGKSFFWVLYGLFKAYTNPFFECIIASNTPKMGKRLFRVLNRIIDANELLTERRNPDNKKEIPNNQDEMEYNHGFFEVTSVGTTPRSAHVNLAIADDPLRDDKRYSDDFIKNYIFGQLFPIVQVKKGRMIISGTPMHYKDIFHTVMRDTMNKKITNGRISAGEHKGFYCISYPAVLNVEKEEVLLPEVFTYEELLNIRKTQGDLYFTREYLLICLDESKALFPTNLIRRCSDNSIPYLYNGEENVNYVIGVDVATSGAASADFSAYTILELRGKKNEKEGEEEYITEKVVRHIFHEKGVEIKKQVEVIYDLSLRFNNAMVLVEKNNVGVALIQELRRRNVNVDEFVTDKFKKESAIRFLINELQNGRMWFPEDVQEVQDLKNELRQFGIKEIRGKERMESLSGHDDLVDSLWIANMATQQYTGGCSFAIAQD